MTASTNPFAGLLRPSQFGSRLTPAAAQTMVDAAGAQPLSPALAAAVREATGEPQVSVQRLDTDPAADVAVPIQLTASDATETTGQPGQGAVAERVDPATGEISVQEVAPVPAAPAEPMESVAVITGHSNSQLGQILVGIVGRVQADKFKIDPAYARINQLFEAVDTVNVGDARFEIVAMPSRDVDAFRDNLIRCSARRSDDIGAVMLNAERNRVATAASTYLTERGLPAFDVPVNLTAEVPQMDEAATKEELRATESDLVAESEFLNGTLRIDLSREAVAIDTDAGAREAAARPTATEWRGHIGAMQLQVSTSAQTLAMDAEQALRIATNFIPIVERNIGNLQNTLTWGPASIQNATMLPYESYRDDDDSNWGERYSDR